MGVLDFEQAVKSVTPVTKINAKEFKSSGSFPIVSQEAALISGYWDREQDVMHFERPVVVFGDHTRNVKFVDFDFVAGADGVKIFQPIEELEPKYLYYWLLAFPVEGLGYSRHYRLLKGRSILVPRRSAQLEVVSKLDKALGKIDRAIELTLANNKNIDILFKQELKQVFHDPINETRNILDVCELKSGTTIPKNLEKETGDLLYVKVGDMNYPGNEKFIQGSSRYASTNDIHPRYIIPEGSIIFPKRGGAIATNKKRIITKPTIVDLNTMALIPKKSLNPKLLYFWFLQYDLSTISSGTSIPQINNYSFKDTYIAVSNDLVKQEELALRLEELHTRINDIKALYSKKISMLTALKNSLLGEAFSESAVK